MGKKYSGHGEAAVGTNKTVLTMISTTTIRPKLYHLIVSSSATPTDQVTSFRTGRFTAVGTEGSGYTPEPLDPNDPASAADFGVGTFSVEPTYTGSAELLQFDLNLRSSFQWIAVPGGELVAPATANNGLGTYSTSSGGTGTHTVTKFFEE